MLHPRRAAKRLLHVRHASGARAPEPRAPSTLAPPSVSYRLTHALALVAVVAGTAAAQEPLTATLYGANAQNTPDGGIRATEAYSTIVTQGGPTGPNPGGPTAPGNPDNARFAAGYGQGYDGVVSLVIRTPQGNFGCTGSLINARQILTAAHCVTNGSNVVTANTVDVRFQGPSNTFQNIITTQGSGVSVNPAYSGLVFANADVAVITMPVDAPSYATPLMLYNGPAASVLGQRVTFVGYGTTGTGATGDAQAGYAFARRVGFNRFDATCQAVGLTEADEDCEFTNNANNAIWTADFDNGGNVGSPVNGYNGNAICQLFGNPVGGAGSDPLLCNRQVTNDILDEVGIGRGDSGGPALFNGMIVGVASWGARIDSRYAFGGWGTISGHASVLDAGNAAWIAAQVVPEPGTYAMVVMGLVGTGLVARRRRQQA